MQIRNLGGSGLRVSAVGLGCNNFGQRTDLETSRKVIHRAIDLGVTLFDTADIYAGMGGSETVLGAVLGDRRKDIVLAAKYSKPMSKDGTKQGASRRYIMEAVEASLRRLKTDYIDLYQQHDYDPLTPIEESLRALDDLVRQGKVRYIGNSNFPAWRIGFMYEATNMADEVQRMVMLFRQERENALPQTHQQCSQQAPVPLKDNHLTCCKGVKTRECPHLLALEKIERCTPADVDTAKAWTCAAHIVSTGGDFMNEGFLLRVDDRMFWDNVHASLMQEG